MDINVILTNMPCGIRGFTQITTEPDGNYATIVLNARLTHEMNKITYRHEAEHINEDDIQKDCIDDIERIRHHENS